MSAQVYPYLSFESAKNAIEYYTEVFFATNQYRQEISEDQAEGFGLPLGKLEDTTSHGGFTIAGAKIMCADAIMAAPQTSSRVSILLNFSQDDSNEAQALFDHVAQSQTGRVIFPISEQSFGGGLGQLVDKYGITWMFRVEPNK